MAVSPLQKRRKCNVEGSCWTPLRLFGQNQEYFEALRSPVMRFFEIRVSRLGILENSIFKTCLKSLKGICENGLKPFFAHSRKTPKIGAKWFFRNYGNSFSGIKRIYEKMVAQAGARIRRAVLQAALVPGHPRLD